MPQPPMHPTPNRVLTDERLRALAPLTPQKRLATVLLWLFEGDILDDADYGLAICRAIGQSGDDVDDAEEGGPLC
jgi:hypothetical protein